jgi:putative ABC transport system permease protein
MVDAILFRPYPFRDLDRIVALWETIPKVGAEHYGVSPANYFDWKEQNRVFDDMTAYRSWNAALTGPHEPEPVQAYFVLPSFFPLLGVSPLKGRFFSVVENQKGATEVVVSYGFWQERLGADPNVLGAVLSLNGLDYTVIGVMPKEFDFPMYAEIWGPWIVTPADRSERGQHSLNVLARLRPGISLLQARIDMNNIGGRLAREYPLANSGRDAGVTLLRESVDQYARRFMAVVAGAVAFLLLLACANVANLQLARGASRQTEMAIRTALGARRGRLARQLLTEGLLLSFVAGGIGLLLGVCGLAIIKANMPQLVARHVASFMHAQLDARMAAFTLAAAIVAGIASTVPAAFQAPSKRLYETLKGGGRTSSISGRRRMRSILVVSEIAFAAVLLSGAGLMVNAFRNLARMHQGFDPHNVITFNISLQESKFPGRVEVTSFYKETLRRLSALPEIQSAAVISELPALADSRSSSVLIEGQPIASSERPLRAEVRVISEDYFRTIAMPIRRGRAFRPQDDADSLPVAIISESAAQRFWSGQDPLGHRAKLASTELKTPWLTVIGVVGDVRHFFLDSEVRPTIYIPYAQQPIRSLNLVMRTGASLSRTMVDVRESVQAVDARVPVYGVERISRFFNDLAGGVEVVGALMGLFALVALALAAAGVYAVMAYSVAQRKQEIGIRMAMGAHRGDILKLIVGNAVRLLGIGLGLGMPVALALGRLMSSILPGVVALEPFPFVSFAAVLSAFGLLAGYIPARQAAKVDPLVALRNE